MEQTPSELRQNWLEAATRALRPMFEAKGKPLPAELRVSMGWPQNGKRSMGECWSDLASTDGHREVFISPILDADDVVLGTLAHELCHAALPSLGHSKVFTDLGRSIGLVGKPAHLGEGGPAFAWLISDFVRVNGHYPAGAMLRMTKTKQATAMLKVQCLECGYVVRTTAKWLATGTPICPCNNEPMECV